MRDHLRLRHLTPHERDVLAEFLSRLREQCGDRIAHVWLFGSKVRGDFDEESDVDLLIVVSEGDDTLQRAVGEITYSLSLEHGVLLCEHVVSTWRFAQMRAPRAHLQKCRWGRDRPLAVGHQVPEDRGRASILQHRLGGRRRRLWYLEKTTRQIVDRAEQLIARLEQFLRERGLLTENGEG